jgi:hypothetical protein
MSEKIVLLTSFSVFLLSAMVVTSVVAQPRTVGVAAGNWFKYGTFDVNWSSNDPNATFPPSGWEVFADLNKTEWGLIRVEDVSGTNVTIQQTTHFKNGTEAIEGGYVNVDTGDGNMSLVVISANLNANDAFYTSGSYSTWKINETIVRAYPNGARETNLLNMTYEHSWTVNETQYYYYFTMDIYWDKLTGILVEDYYRLINQTGEYLTTWSALSGMTESNGWVVPEFPSFLILPLFMTVTLLAVTTPRRSRLKHPNISGL